MNNPSRLIKLSSLIYLLISFFIIPYFTVFGGILLTMGAILLTYSFLSIEQLKKKKTIITLIAVISIFTGVIVAVMLFTALDKLSSFKVENDNAPPEDAITSEAKRIDLLLKLGLVMILISGVLFATTSWDIMSDLFKVFGLVLMGGIFLGLSKFSEEKLKIEKTTKAYYILGLAFFFLTWVGIGVFGTISPEFSYTGEAKNVVYFFTFVLLGGILYLINKKFPSKEYECYFYICGYLSIYHLLTFIGASLLLTVMIISIISLLINIYIKDKKYQTLSELTNLMSYLYTPIIVTKAIDAHTIIVVITSLINIINVLYLSTKTNDKIDNTLSIIISYTLVITSILRIYIISGQAIAIFIFISLLYLIINCNRLNVTKSVMNTNQILYNVISTIIIFAMLESTLQQIILSSVYMFINYINCYVINQDYSKVDLYFQPVVILLLMLKFTNIFDTYLFNIDTIYSYILAAFVYIIIHYLSHTEKVKKIYYVALIVITIITALSNLITSNIIINIILILLSTYIYHHCKNMKENENVIAYIFILINIHNFANSLVLKELISEVFTSLFELIVFITLTYISKEKNIKTVNYISIIIPLYNIINLLTLQSDLKMILDNIFGLYLVFLIVTLIVKDEENKDVISTIGTTLATITIIFEHSVLIGIYVGILGISIILLTYNKQLFKKAFYCGVVITILNIIVQLGEYWAKIPLWLYLLLAGGGIVAFVTYKEAHKKNEPPKSVPQQQKEQPIVNKQICENNEPVIERADFCPFCGTKNPGGNYCLNCGNYLIITKKQ